MATGIISGHRLTTAAYRRMGDAGILSPGARVELIEGEIIDMAPIGSRHAGTVEQLAGILRRAVGERAMVRTQQPVSLDEHSEPEPDIAVVQPRADYYKSEHPSSREIQLLVEVADASLRYDLEIKVPLYARHGVREVWVLDLVGRRLQRHSQPVADSYKVIDAPPLDALPIGVLEGVAVDLRAVFTFP